MHFHVSNATSFEYPRYFNVRAQDFGRRTEVRVTRIARNGMKCASTVAPQLRTAPPATPTTASAVV